MAYSRRTGTRRSAPLDRLLALGRSEADEQRDVFSFALSAMKLYPVLELMFHVPNEGKRKQSTGGFLVGQGMKAGVSDIILPAARRGYTALIIEMKKRGELPKTTDDQERFLARAWQEGALTYVIDRAEDAIDVLLWYVGGKRHFGEPELTPAKGRLGSVFVEHWGC